MRKILFLIATLLFSCTYSIAQEVQDVQDTVSSQKRVRPLRRFERFVKEFIDFNNYDTTYISPNRYNFAVMLTNNTILEHYRIGTSEPKEQRMSFAPNPSYKIGAYFGWRWIFVGWSVDAAEVFGGHNKHNSKKTEFTLSLYSSKLGVDFYYWKIGNDFKLKNLEGFMVPNSSSSPTDNTPNLKTSIDFDGMKAYIKGFNMYYIFNNKHFSYPAAFSQSTNQRKSVGTFLSGISYSLHQMSFDYMKLPSWILDQIEAPLRVDKLEYRDFSIHFGYAYNWVFARNCLACVSIAPAVAYKRSRIFSQYEENNDRHHNINFDLITRAGVVYNNSKYFIGASWVGHTYDYKQKYFSMNNTLGTLQLYIGFNFGKKKEYRSKK